MKPREDRVAGEIIPAGRLARSMAQAPNRFDASPSPLRRVKHRGGSVRSRASESTGGGTRRGRSIAMARLGGEIDARDDPSFAVGSPFGTRPAAAGGHPDGGRPNSEGIIITTTTATTGARNRTNARSRTGSRGRSRSCVGPAGSTRRWPSLSAAAWSWSVGTGEAMGGQVAEAMARLAELRRLRGDYAARAVRRRKKKPWPSAWAWMGRTTGGRPTPGWPWRSPRRWPAWGRRIGTRLGGALRREQEAARLEEQDKCGEAERVASEALETYRAVVGPESAEVARAWHRIGRCRWARHDVGGAKEANERALTIRRKVLPGTHPDLGRSLNNLGLAESRLGNKRRAREFLEEAVRIWRSSLESSSPLTAGGSPTWETCSTRCGIMRRPSSAIRRRWRSAASPCQRTTPISPAACTTWGWCSTRCGSMQQPCRAIGQALAIRRKSLPPGHPDIARSLISLGNVQYELREYAAAKQSYEQAWPSAASPCLRTTRISPKV